MATVSKSRLRMYLHLTHVTVTFLYSKQNPQNLTSKLALTTAWHGQLSSAGIQSIITAITKTWIWTPSRTSHISPQYLIQLPSFAVYNPLIQTDHVQQVWQIQQLSCLGDFFHFQSSLVPLGSDIFSLNPVLNYNKSCSCIIYTYI